MSKMNDNFFVPERFESAIILHVIKNMLDGEEMGQSLILGIQGAPGEGKTFQCQVVLERLGIKTILISGSEFESQHAGAPASLLVNRYQYASDLIKTRKAKYCVLLVDDIDVGIGEFGDMVQYTVNTQHINATLMHMCDFPHKVGDSETLRIPIIATANDLTKLYQPLTRPGRMTIFEWRPNDDEKFETVKFLYRNTEIPLLTIRETFQLHSNMPIAFFSTLKSKMIDEQLLNFITTYGRDNIINLMRNKPELLKESIKSSSPSNIIELANSLASSQLAKNFLTESFK